MSVDHIVDQLKLPKETQNFLVLLKSLARFFLIFSFIPILLGAWLGYYYFNKEKQKSDSYEATISFIQTDEINTFGSSIGAAQFPGLNFGGLSKDITVSLQGIVRSDAILSEALFSEVKNLPGNPNEALINLYFRTYFPDEYEEIKVTIFDLDSLSPKQLTKFNFIKESINNEKAQLLEYNAENILQLKIETKDQNLSFAFVNNLYDSLSKFFSSATDKTYSRTLKEMTRSRDSTEKRLREYQNDLARVQTRQGFNEIPLERLDNQKLYEKITLTQQQYTTMYAEVEAYKIRNKLNESVFTKLSSPILPLPKKSPNSLKQGIIGSAIGFFGGLFILLILYILRIVAKLYQRVNSDYDGDV